MTNEQNKMVLIDEFGMVQKDARIAFLELEIQKIKTGVTKASSQQILSDTLTQYQKELAELKESTN